MINGLSWMSIPNEWNSGYAFATSLLSNKERSKATIEAGKSQCSWHNSFSFVVCSLISEKMCRCYVASRSDIRICPSHLVLKLEKRFALQLTATLTFHKTAVFHWHSVKTVKRTKCDYVKCAHRQCSHLL